MILQSPFKWAPWGLTQFSQLPSAAPSYFPESYQQFEISSLSKVILLLGKSRSHMAPSLGYRGLSHLGHLRFWQKNSGDVMHEQECCCDEVAHSCGHLNHLNSFCRGLLKLNAKFDVDLLLCSLSHFECEAMQYVFSLNGIYCPLWLIQWSHGCSCMWILVHSPWCPTKRSHYINNGWTFSYQTIYSMPSHDFRK